MTEYDCSKSVDIGEEPLHQLVISNQYVRAFAVEIPPRTRTLCHEHPHEYMLYVASGAEIVSAAKDEEPKRLSYRTGECELAKAGLVHVVENLASQPFRNVVVELLPGAANLRRGAEPLVMDGEAAIERILNSELGEIVCIDLLLGAEIEIAGPAVLAVPNSAVMMREIDDFDIPLDQFKKLMWVCPPRKVGIRNLGPEDAQLLVFRPGKQMQMPYLE